MKNAEQPNELQIATASAKEYTLVCEYKADEDLFAATKTIARLLVPDVPGVDEMVERMRANKGTCSKSYMCVKHKPNTALVEKFVLIKCWRERNIYRLTIQRNTLPAK